MVEVKLGDLVRQCDNNMKSGTVVLISKLACQSRFIWFFDRSLGFGSDFEHNLQKNCGGVWMDPVSRDLDFGHPTEANPRINVAHNTEPKNPADDWVSLTEYPHTCTRCGAPSYNGLNRVDCSAGCNER